MDIVKILKNIFLILYCKNNVLFVYYQKEQISSFNCTAHNTLMNEIFDFTKPSTRQEKKREV